MLEISFKIRFREQWTLYLMHEWRDRCESWSFLLQDRDVCVEPFYQQHLAFIFLDQQMQGKCGFSVPPAQGKGFFAGEEQQAVRESCGVVNWPPALLVSRVKVISFGLAPVNFDCSSYLIVLYLYNYMFC